MLTAAAHGVAANPTAMGPVLATVIQELLVQGLKVEEAAIQRLKADPQSSVAGQHVGQRFGQRDVGQRSNMMTPAADANGTTPPNNTHDDDHENTGGVRDGPLSLERDDEAIAHRQQQQAHAEGLHVHLMLEFALHVLHAALRKGPLVGRDPAVLALINPLLPLLVRCLACRHAGTVSLALRCMSLIIDLPLPGMWWWPTHKYTRPHTHRDTHVLT